MKKTFTQAMIDRRSNYTISNASPVSRDRIEEIIRTAVKYMPTSFNCQSSRVVLLYGEKHARLWHIVMETLRRLVPAGRFGRTAKKIEGFAAGYGTICYFDETAITADFMEKFPTYRDNFPIWAQQANGMLQFAVWSMLEEEGLGVNLQHYNPLIDDEVKKTFQLPDSWQLIAQMPFGVPTAGPLPKTFAPPEERIRILG